MDECSDRLNFRQEEQNPSLLTLHLERTSSMFAKCCTVNIGFCISAQKWCKCPGCRRIHTSSNENIIRVNCHTIDYRIMSRKILQEIAIWKLPLFYIIWRGCSKCISKQVEVE